MRRLPPSWHVGTRSVIGVQRPKRFLEKRRPALDLPINSQALSRALSNLAIFAAHRSANVWQSFTYTEDWQSCKFYIPLIQRQALVPRPFRNTPLH